MWAVVPEADLDEEEISKVMTDLKGEWKKTKREHSTIKELMNKSFPRRRQMILQEGPALSLVLQTYPPLSNMLYVSNIQNI